MIFKKKKSFSSKEAAFEKMLILIVWNVKMFSLFSKYWSRLYK